MGTENHNADQNRQNQAGQDANQTQDGERNFDRQQNQQGGKTPGGQSGGGQAGQTDPNRDRQSGNPSLDDDDNTGNNAGQQR